MARMINPETKTVLDQPLMNEDPLPKGFELADDEAIDAVRRGVEENNAAVLAKWEADKRKVDAEMEAKRKGALETLAASGIDKDALETLFGAF